MDQEWFEALFIGAVIVMLAPDFIDGCLKKGQNDKTRNVNRNRRRRASRDRKDA